ncbi:esterase/lipase family protein [Allorhodopirellula solitaria]|uniref:Alpha/beta hydrolase family protein n=1 Tax=Allorhodopirellula solitaria TaxID=2527987 RepID=A0A5C5YKC3_9BACT|nr:lipase [Allorhodopirellula solitaria]TWT75350.1 Alpha/beta hydrolase family protein [Allorhodopirellula solitaria]
MLRTISRPFLKSSLIAMAMACCVFASCYAVGHTESETVAKNFNVALPTAGGAQFWTDLEARGGYRVQRNALTGHCRILDSQNIRRGWGSEEDACELLDELCPNKTAPASKPVVVLLHGLMRTDGSMKSMESALRADGYDQIIRFGYASTRSSLGESSKALHRVLAGQHPDAEFCFVGHSMGNIVTRHLIGDLQRNGDPERIVSRCRSMVMLGPPNQGAAIARRLGATGVFEWVAGPGAMELGTNWTEVEANLATPPFPFAIVAGKIAVGAVRNPLVDGESDFVVSWEEAQLDGAETVHEVAVLHSFLMNDPAVQEWTIEFLDAHLE